MKTIFSIIALLTLSTSTINAQGEFPAGKFENWEDFTNDLGEGLNLEAETFLFPEHSLPFLRFAFTVTINGLVEALLNLGGEPFELSQSLLGISRSTEASEGNYALQMAGDTTYNLSDIVIYGGGVSNATGITMDIKHVGTGIDTLFIYAFLGNSFNIPPIDDEGNFITDSVNAFFTGGFLWTVDESAYSIYDIPFTLNDNGIGSDTLTIWLLALSDINGSNSRSHLAYFLIDNITVQGATSATTDNIVSEVKLFPTLARDIVNFQSDAGVIDRIMIVTNDGREIMHQKVDRSEGKVDVSHLSSGLYFLHMISEAGTATKSFFKK